MKIIYRSIRRGNFRFIIDTSWGWRDFNLSLRGLPNEENILSFSSRKPIPWWFRVGPFAIAWRWD